jgi:RNA-binding protein YhbY
MANEGITTINIGRRGLDGAVIKEIKEQLRAKGLIKVKALKCVQGDADEIFRRIVAETGASPDRRVGRTLVLRKE